MNPVIEELNKKRDVSVPSWANRAVAEIERLEAQRDELLVALREVADWTERYTLPGHPVVTVARRAIAKVEG